MTTRRYASSEVSDRYEPRRDQNRGDPGRRDDRVWEDDLEFRSRPPPRDRERTTILKEEVKVRERSPPTYLREDYGRASAGPMVLRGREREEFEVVPRRRSPSLEPVRIRREPPPVSREDRPREHSRPPAPRELERDEYMVRREDRPRYAYEMDDRYDRRPPPRDHLDREEIIIRRNHDDSREPLRYGGQDGAYVPPRAISHERERSRADRGRAESDTDEIIIRRSEVDGGRFGPDREREEIIIRKHGSRSPSPASARVPLARPAPLPEPPIITAPSIHQEVITHHRHVDHGYDIDPAPSMRARSRPPSPPMPPREDESRIEIHHRGERNGRDFHEDIIIDRNQSSSAPPSRDRYDDSYERESYYNRRPAPPPERWRDQRDPRDLQEEADYYNQRAMERAYPGEGYHGTAKDWAIVDVPPGTHRVRMDGAGGGAQEITWQRYNGVRRSRFMPDGSDEGYGSEVGRPGPAPAAGGELGRRYAGAKDPREGLWTEITKDLVVKEAITEAGYEFEETDDFFYIIAYLKFEDVARLVGLSADIRHARRKRMKEMDWERKALPPAEQSRRPLAIEEAPCRPGQGPWDREQERLVEREWYRPRPKW